MDIKKILGDSCTDEIAANLQAEIEKETDHEALRNQLTECICINTMQGF